MTGRLKMSSLCILVVAVIAGCGGNSSVTSEGTPITVAFAQPPPSAVATQIGNGAFTAASLSSDNVTGVVLPPGTTNYAVAYVCPLNSVLVLEASAQDGAEVTLACPLALPFPSGFGAATGSLNASAIAGATMVLVRAPGFLEVNVGVSEPFNISLPAGTDDVAFLVQDKNQDLLALKIFHAQGIPGAINGGAPVVFGPGDVPVMQPLTAANVPAGFVSPLVSAEYQTVNGTVFNLAGFLFAPSTYAAVPAASTASGDGYIYIGIDSNPETSQTVETVQSTTSGGGPFTVALPAPWSFAGPSPATFPTFTFNYSGFSGLPAINEQASIFWNQIASVRAGSKNRVPSFVTSSSGEGATPLQTNPAAGQITVTATANFQGGANTITIPDLSALPGFPSPAASGTQISWFAQILGGTAQQFPLSINSPPLNSSIAMVGTAGTYTQP